MIRNTPNEDYQDSFENDSMMYYTPEQREVIRKGMRILARVAVRSYIRRQASASSQSESAAGDSDE